MFGHLPAALLAEIAGAKPMLPVRKMTIRAAALMLGLTGSTAACAVELDGLDQATFYQLLEYELDDIAEQYGEDAQLPIQTLANAIQFALSDAGDDEEEQSLSFADIQEECQEAGDASVQAVIYAALQQADSYQDDPQVEEEDEEEDDEDQEPRVSHGTGFIQAAADGQKLAYNGMIRVRTALNSTKSTFWNVSRRR